MISVTGVHHHYDVKPVLRGVDLEVREGELVALMGPNGMGKSTLLGVVGGTLWPQRGRVEICGMQRRRAVEEEREIRKRVFFLPDSPWLPGIRTCREFLMAVGRLYEIDAHRLFEQIDHLLAVFDLDPVADSPISSCSAGQHKKIALAGALVSEAPVLVLDEPFSGGLDPAAILALKRVLARLARNGSTVLMATPVPEIIEGLANRIAVLRDGVIASTGTEAEVRGDAESLAEALGELFHPGSRADVDRYLESR